MFVADDCSTVIVMHMTLKELKLELVSCLWSYSTHSQWGHPVMIKVTDLRIKGNPMYVYAVIATHGHCVQQKLHSFILIS